MAVRHFLENGAAKVEVWMGSGQSDSLNAQVTIVDLSEKGVEVQFNEIGCCNLVACEYSPLSSFLAVMDVLSSFLPREEERRLYSQASNLVIALLLLLYTSTVIG